MKNILRLHFSRTALSLSLAGLLLVSYIGGLLWFSYASLMSLQSSNRQRLVLDSEKHAIVVDTYFSERRKDLASLAAGWCTSSFFSNRALGISMEYGLRDSLELVDTSLDDAVRENTVQDLPVFKWIVFLDRNGTPLADSGPWAPPPEKGPEWASLLTPDSHDQTLLTRPGPYGPIVILTQPCFHQGKYSGQIVVRLASEALITSCINSTALDVRLATLNAGRLQTIPAPEPALPEILNRFGPPPWPPRVVSELPEPDSSLVLVPLSEGPLGLIRTVSPRRGLVLFSPAVLLSALTALACVVILATIGTVRNKLKTVALNARITESRKQRDLLARRNEQLNAEIRAREKVEAELVEAKQAADAASLAKSRFLATMSHEIRTPLHGVIGASEILADSNLDPKQTRFVHMIQHSGEMLLSLVNDILDFSRVEENALELVRDKFELRDILAPIPHYRAMAEQTGTTITVAPVPACPPLIGDRRRLEQVLGNLLNNAVKFTHQGRITVELTITNQSPSEVLVQLDVADTGPGVPEESRTRIFEPFRQADEGVNRAHGGSGLGLAIVNRLCRLMGGTVELAGSGEPGARFRVTLPFPLAASRPPGDEPETETKPKPIPDLHCRVLVVEDNPDAMDIITELLTVRGCSVHQAADGPEGVRAAEDTDFDLIFMDCHLPVLNGYEATRRIRRTLQDQGRPQPPIVALTADAFSGDREKCLQAGMQDHLSKPFTPDQLISMLEQHLSQPQCET